jgi:hypothetical protein
MKDPAPTFELIESADRASRPSSSARITDLIQLGVRLSWNTDGLARTLWVAFTGFAATSLLIIGDSILMMPAISDEFVISATPDTPYIPVLAIALLLGPLGLLASQAMRLGSATRERSLANLRLAGTTGREVRLISALSVGLPGAAGSVLGLLGLPLGRSVLGGIVPGSAPDSLWSRTDSAGIIYLATRLVPRTVTAPWWIMIVCVISIALASFGLGWTSSRVAAASPLHTARSPRTQPVGPRSLIPMAIGIAFFAPFMALPNDLKFAWAFGVLPMIAMPTLALSMVGATPWLTQRLSTWLSSWTASPSALLATQRLILDPRSGGRAGATLGAACLTISAATTLVSCFIVPVNRITNDYESRGALEVLTMTCATISALAIIPALAGVTALVIHGVENILDRKRAYASAVATGLPIKVLMRAQHIEALLTAVPAAALGLVLGSSSWIILILAPSHLAPPSSIATVGLICLAILVTVVVVINVVSLAMAPWIRRSCSTKNLRTP